MKFSRKLTLCNPKGIAYYKYEIELPPEILQQYEALPKARIFSWKYDFLKNLLVERLGKFPQLLFWSGNGPESKLIAREFRGCSINWDKAVAYLALNPVEEYSDNAGILFLTNGVAFCLEYATAEFFPWLEVAVMPLMAHEAEDTPQVEVETPHQSLWRFDVSPDQQKLFDALVTLFEDLRGFCRQAVPQLFQEYLRAYLELNNQLLLQLKTDSWEQIEDAMRLHTYYMMLAQDCQMLEVLLPAAQNLVNQALIPMGLAAQARNIVSFFAEHNVQFSDEMIRKINHMASHQQEESAGQIERKIAELFVQLKFAEAEQRLSEALQEMDHPTLVSLYYGILQFRRRSHMMQAWMNTLPQLPDHCAQRTFLEKQYQFLEIQQKKIENNQLLSIAVNEDPKGLYEYATYHNKMGMTPLMYAVLYDIPYVVSYYQKCVPKKEAMYSWENVLGMRAIELAAMKMTGLEFCTLCNEMAKADLLDTRKRYEERLAYVASKNDVRMTLTYHATYPQDRPQPFRSVMQSPPRLLMEDLESTCRSIQKKAKRLFYMNLLLYAPGPLQIDKQSVYKHLPPPLSGDILEQLVEEFNVSVDAFKEDLIAHDPSLQKDEFETMAEYEERICETLDKKTSEHYGSWEDVLEHILLETKKRSLEHVDFDKNLEAFTLRRSLVLELCGWTDRASCEQLQIGKYDAEDEFFNLGINPFFLVQTCIPRAVARQLAQQHRDDGMVSVEWKEFLIAIGDDDMLGSAQELEQWVIDHEDEMDRWDYEHSSLLRELADVSGGLISPKWAEECASVCSGRLLSECISGEAQFDDEESEDEWQDKRMKLFLHFSEKPFGNNVNETLFRHVVSVVFAAYEILKQDKTLDIYAGGCIEFEKEKYEVFADLPINQMAAFPPPSSEWFDG